MKLYIYGYLNRVRSSRRLEAECHRNIEVIWLLRTLKPDFKTIADFRADNRAAFKSVFRQFTLLCKRLDLFGRELLAVDGTRIKAVNNKDRNFTRGSLKEFIEAADERLADYLARLDDGDVAEAAPSGARTENLAEKIEALREKRGRYGAMLAELDRTGESHISLTDPDSRAMGTHQGATGHLATKSRQIGCRAPPGERPDLGKQFSHGLLKVRKVPSHHSHSAFRPMDRPRPRSPFAVRGRSAAILMRLC